MTDLDSLLNMLTEGHRVRYSTDSSEIAPMIMTFIDNEIIGVYVIPQLTTPELRAHTCDIIKQLVERDDAEGYVLHTEAWMATENPNGPYVAPSQHPERVEVLMMSAYTPDQDAYRFLRIVRDRNGIVQELADEKSTAGSLMWSRFNIFNLNVTIN